MVRPVVPVVAALVAFAQATFAQTVIPHVPFKPPAAPPVVKEPRVRVGLEVLRARGFQPLVGRRVGLVTNHTAVDSRGESAIDIFARAPGVRLVALFSPEHGIRGTEDRVVDSSTDERTGLPIHSLYGKSRRPTNAMLAGIDVLVFDIQDIGTRFYTYISTMGYCMEAAARRGIPVLVLDRPNPIGGVRVEGPPMDARYTSFTGYHPLPSRHGMTAGELAAMFNAEKQIACKLIVVAMSGWTRDQYWEDTGRAWIDTSPNMRSPTEALLYPGVGSLESSNVSVGRGTARPFEVVGAPWVDGRRLARMLESRHLACVRFSPIVYTPTASVYSGKRCGGISIEVVDRTGFDSVRCGLEIAWALYRLYPRLFEIRKIAGMVGQEWVVARIVDGLDPAHIERAWKVALGLYLRRRARYLLYPEANGAVGGTVR